MSRVRRRGLTRAEIAVILAIVFFIAAFAVPNIRATQLRANQIGAMETLAQIASANALYFREFQQYAPDLESLYRSNDLEDENIYNARLESDDTLYGYCFHYICKEPGEHYLAFAFPGRPSSGTIMYVINELDSIHFRDVEEETLERSVLWERYGEYDFNVAGRLSPWFQGEEGVVLGRRVEEPWRRALIEVD